MNESIVERRAFLKATMLVIFVIACTLPASILTKSPLEEIPVIIDMDAAPDDWGAMLYFLKHPRITVRAITVSCGVSYVDTGVTNTLRILNHLGIQDIPVAAGKDTPLIGDHAFPKPWRDASFSFYGLLYLPITDLQPSPMNASELIISTINSSTEKVTLVALGPLTNIAIALQSEPTIKEKIEKINIMGGAINVSGNVGLESSIPNYMAEWNIYVDPHAANIVLNSGIPIMLVPLDATNEVPQTEEFLTRLGNVMKTPEAHLLYNLTTPGLYFWDQLIAVATTDPSVLTLEMHCINVITDIENHEGWTNSTDAGCMNIQVALHADALKFEELFIGIINAYETPTTTTTSTTTETITETAHITITETQECEKTMQEFGVPVLTVCILFIALLTLNQRRKEK